jgi:hypothetical protein
MRPLVWVGCLAIVAGCSDSNALVSSMPDLGSSTAPDLAPVARPDAVDYLVIAADPLAASAQRWADYRARLGHKTALARISTVLAGASTASAAQSAIHDYVRNLWNQRDATRPFYVLLVGDATAGTVDNNTIPAAHVADSSAGSSTSVSTDNVYADMDGDDIPDLAIGRIPAASDAAVDAVRLKVEAYDRDYFTGPWNRRINLFASTSGFGEPTDSLIEGLVFAIVEEVPYAFDVTMTYAKQASPYAYIPQRFSDEVYARINQGALLVSYIGHGSEDSFADYVWSGASYPIMDPNTLDELRASPKPPILTLIACSTGGFERGDCVSERILRHGGGPPAVLSSTEISHPYPNAIFIRELGIALLQKRLSTIGEAFIAAKRQMIESNDELRMEIDQGVSFLLVASARDGLKRSHLYMYTLFGDPAMRVAYPGAAAQLTVPTGPVAVGAAMSVSARFDDMTAGEATFTLESRRSNLVGTPAPVPPDGNPTRDAVIVANYNLANNKVITSAVVPVQNGAATAALGVPAGLASDDYYVKVYASDRRSDAAAWAKITIP